MSLFLSRQVGTHSIMYLVQVVPILVTISSASSFSTTMSSAEQKLMKLQPPILTLPLRSSSASLMVLSRQILKRVGECWHPCRTPAVYLNKSPVLPLKTKCTFGLVQIFDGLYD